MGGRAMRSSSVSSVLSVGEVRAQRSKMLVFVVWREEQMANSSKSRKIEMVNSTVHSNLLIWSSTVELAYPNVA